MKKSLIMSALVVVTACSDSGAGLMAPSVRTSAPPAAVGDRARAIVLRGTVTGPAGATVGGASIQVTATPASSTGQCNGSPLFFTSSTGSTGEFRTEVRVAENVTSLCVTVAATPPSGSTLRGATVDVGRISPGIVTPGSIAPERRVDLTLGT